MNNLAKITLIIISFGLGSCFQFRMRTPAGEFKKSLENASPDFRQGWLDGCDAGSAAGSNAFNQMAHKGNKIDGYKMSYSPDYQTAWSNAWWYCMRRDWLNQQKSSSMWSGPFGGYK